MSSFQTSNKQVGPNNKALSRECDLTLFILFASGNDQFKSGVLYVLFSVCLRYYVYLNVIWKTWDSVRPMQVLWKLFFPVSFVAQSILAFRSRANVLDAQSILALISRANGQAPNFDLRQAVLSSVRGQKTRCFKAMPPIDRKRLSECTHSDVVLVSKASLQSF